MFTRYHNSWQLVKASWAVLRSDKQLILFPIISAVTMIMISIVFLIPVGVLFGSMSQATVQSESNSDTIGYAVLFVFYLVSYTISIFFNVALVGAAMIRLDGGSPTMGDGLRIARSKFSIILQYALISATVGIVLRFIQDKFGFLGSIVAWLGGLAWNIATYLVVPILAAQDINPVDAVKQSANLLKRTWGEQLIGDAGIGFAFGVLTFLTIVVGMILTFALGVAANSVALIIFFIVATIVVVIALSVIAGALSGIYQAALYRYAETGVVPDHFDIEMIKNAFRDKKKKNDL